MELLDDKKISARRKSLKWIFGSLAGLSFAGFLGFSKKRKTVKMLSQDGKLVEIPLDKLPAKKRKAEKKEIQTWIWKHNT